MAAFTRAALASLSRLVEVGLGVSFILRPAVPEGLAGGVVFPAGLASGWTLLVVLVVAAPGSGSRGS